MPKQDSYPALAALDPSTYVTGFYTSGGQLITVKVPFAFIYGNKWNVGTGAPVITGIATGDLYLDESTGDVWRWNQTALNWGTQPIMNIVNGEFTWPLWVPSKPTASQVIGALDSPWNGSITTNFTNCYANADVAATASAVFSITQNGSQIGTITFGAGQSVGVFSTGGPFNINKTDIIRVIGPVSQDATLSGVRVSMVFAVGGTVGATALLGLALQKANNLSDVANAQTSRTNLAVPGLTTANTMSGVNTFTAGPAISYVSPSLTLNDTGGANAAYVIFQSAGNTEWTIHANSAAAGLYIDRYNAAGSFVDTPVSISSTTGVVTFIDTIAVSGGTSSFSSGGASTALNINTSGATHSLQINDTGVNGANLSLNGNGATTPNKTIRANGGYLQVVNNAYSGVIFQMDDSGNINTSGGTLTTSGGSVSFGALVATGQSSLAGNTGAEALRAVTTASSVNWVQVQGNITGNGVSVSAAGSDANVNLNLSSKGVNGIGFYTGSLTRVQLLVADAASAVNYLQISGNSTGNGPIISSQGNDTNVAMGLYSKGTGAFFFGTAGGARTQFVIVDTASTVNYMQVQGAPTANGPILSAQGSDTNVNLNLQSKGTGGIVVGAGGGTQLVVANVASAVNYVQVQGAPTANGPTVSAQGSDTNISLGINAKGTGGVFLNTGGGNQVVIANTATTNRTLNLTGSNGGNPTISASAGSVAFASPIAINGSTAHSVLLGQGTGNVTGVGPNATSGLALMSQGASADPIFGNPTGTLINVQRFTSSGTYTPTAGTNTAIIEGCGGGGGGGGAASTSSTQNALGGSGGYAAWGRVRVTSPATQTVTIGAAGAGGAAGGNNGTAGGQTSIGTYLVCPGGVAGGASGAVTFANNMLIAGGVSAGAAATATTSATALVLSGGSSAGISFSSYNAAIGVGAAGGSGPFGIGGAYAVGSAGANATGFGSGGGGAAVGASAAAAAGGNGTAGVVIIYEYA